MEGTRGIGVGWTPLERPDPEGRFLLWGIILLAAGLRLALLGSSGVRLDEVFTWWVATEHGGDVVETLVAVDTHPPLFYLLQHAWLGLTDSLAWARLPSAAFGVGLVPVVYAIGRSLQGRAVGLVAAALVAVSPWHLWHSQDVRGYSLLTLAVALVLLAALRSHSDGPESRSRGPLVFFLAGSIAVLTHNVGIVLVASVAVPQVLFLRRHRAAAARRWEAAAAAVGGIWLLWLPSMIRQLGNVEQNLAWVERETGWLDAVTGVAGVWATSELGDLSELMVASAVAVPLALLGWKRLPREGAARWMLLALLLVLPIFELLSLLGIPFLVVRSLLPTSVALIGLVAAGLASLSYRWLTTAGTAGLAIVLGLGGANLLRADTHAWEQVTAVLEAEVQSDEAVLYVMNVGQLATSWIGTVPGRSFPLPGPFAERQIWDETVTAGAVDRVASEVAGSTPVWLVYAHGDRLDPDGHVLSWLDAEREVDLRMRFGGVELRRYGAASSRRAAMRRVATAPSAAKAKSTSE
ncbi:MAG: glycosyltransferase family 39 protein [Nitriliruptorales bacterium]|nr:glycosyltransferase family 39 protein [Nitriliruptorales bacterium]